MTPEKPTKKKILYVITKSQWGGAQRYVFDLATRLPKDRFDVAVAMGGTGLLKDRLRENSVRTIEVQHFKRDISIFHDVRTFVELVNLFRRERPDVVHLNSAKATTIGALAARVARVPNIVSTIHGWSSNEPRVLWYRMLIMCAEYIGRLLAHHTIVVCRGDERRNTTVIHNGVAETTFLSRSEARAALHIPEDAFVVGSIGEHTRNKNYGVLIQVMKQTDAMLVLIGDGEDTDTLKEKAGPHAIFTGYKPNASELLHAFDIFVLPSKKEGLPYVLLEAGLAHLPVIATPVGGVPDIVMDEVTGMLFPPDSPDALAHAIERYRMNEALCTHHASLLYERVRDEFGLARMLTLTQALY